MTTFSSTRPERKSRILSASGRPRALSAARLAKFNEVVRQNRPAATARPAPKTAARPAPTATARQEPVRQAEPELDLRAAAEEVGAKRSFTSAFKALKQTRLFRSLKKGAAPRKPWTTGLIALFEDYLDVAFDHQRARAYLSGDEPDEGFFSKARREARMLQHLEGMGGSPVQLVRYLNSLLGMDRERDFRHFVVDQIKPRLDALAGRAGELSVQERRLVAALVARASYQVGVRSAENFTKLLRACGAAEAAHWSKSTEKPVERAQQLAQALRVAASPFYRAAVIEAGRDGLKKLASETVGLSLEELHLTWGWLLRSAEALEFDVLRTLADALVTGVLSKGGSAAVGMLSGVLGPTLREVPGGGGLVIQLIVTLTERGDVKSAAQLVETLRGVLQQARANCFPVLTALRECEATPGAVNKDALLRQLESRGATLAGLIPVCSRVLEKGPAFPAGSAAVVSEALLALATLGVVGATASGQRMLHRTLMAQERGRETFLSTLPRVALTLAQPSLTNTLWEAGLTTNHFQFGGRPFLERVALHTGRALVNPLLARGRKGDASTAKALLRSLIRNNAALFGLTADGAYLAAEAIEAQRDKPKMVPLQKTLYRLSKIRKKNALGRTPNSIEPFQDLVTALAAGGLPQPKAGSGARLTLLEFSVNQAASSRSGATKKTNTAAELHLDLQEFPGR